MTYEHEKIKSVKVAHGTVIDVLVTAQWAGQLSRDGGYRDRLVR
jgi:hypothetical protein